MRNETVYHLETINMKAKDFVTICTPFGTITIKAGDEYRDGKFEDRVWMQAKNGHCGEPMTKVVGKKINLFRMRMDKGGYRGKKS